MMGLQPTGREFLGAWPPRTYSVTVTDSHGCSTTTSVVITQPTVLTLAEATGSHVNVTCNGQSNGSFTVTAGGGTPAYSFNDGFATNGTGVFGSLAAATYTVTVTDSHGCSTTTSVVIARPTILTLAEATGFACECDMQRAEQRLVYGDSWRRYTAIPSTMGLQLTGRECLGAWPPQLTR